MKLAGRISRIAALAAAIMAAGVLPAVENDVLYWMIDSSATVQKADGTTVSISSFVSPGRPKMIWTITVIPARFSVPSASSNTRSGYPLPSRAAVSSCMV